MCDALLHVYPAYGLWVVVVVVVVLMVMVMVVVVVAVAAVLVVVVVVLTMGRRSGVTVLVAVTGWQNQE